MYEEEKQKILHLTLKKKWLDMIARGRDDKDSEGEILGRGKRAWSG